MNNPNICPVMGNPVKDIESAPNSEYNGKTYYFCCAGCKTPFDKDPEKYINNDSTDHEGHHHHH